MNRRAISASRSLSKTSRARCGGKARLKRSAGRSLDEANRNLALFYSLLPRSGVPVNQEPTYWLVATLYPLADAATTGTSALPSIGHA